MEWINGLPLYEWAREHRATARQGLQVLTQVAGALAVLHQADALHRDVKGDNILVDAQGRAVLMDYGSSTWAGAPPITESLMPPSTREYRSPEALRFEWENGLRKGAQYQARPADDLYALGVSMYRLVTGVYPLPGADPAELKARLEAPPPRRLPAQALNERLRPELSALIGPLLAEDPEARGLAREVEEAAEAATASVGPEANVPPFGSDQSKVQATRVPVSGLPRSGLEQPALHASVAVPVRVRAQHRAGSSALRPGLAAASLVLMALGLWWVGLEMSQEASEVARAEALGATMAPDAGTQGLGDSALTERGAVQGAPISSKVISLDMPKQPLPGQRRPPCRSSWEEAIQGACWRPLAKIEPPCGDDAYEWQGACYDPSLDRTRPPTSQNPQ